MARLGLRSEKALSQYLRMSQKTLGNIRSGDLELSVPILLWKAECTSTSVEELRSIVGDRRRMLRLSFTMAA